MHSNILSSSLVVLIIVFSIHPIIQINLFIFVCRRFTAFYHALQTWSNSQNSTQACMWILIGLCLDLLHLFLNCNVYSVFTRNTTLSNCCYLNCLCKIPDKDLLTLNTCNRKVNNETVWKYADIFWVLLSFLQNYEWKRKIVTKLIN